MPFGLECPNCQKRYQTAKDMSGQRVKCAACGVSFIGQSRPTAAPPPIPAGAAATPQPAAGNLAPGSTSRPAARSSESLSQPLAMSAPASDSLLADLHDFRAPSSAEPPPKPAARKRKPRAGGPSFDWLLSEPFVLVTGIALIGLLLYLIFGRGLDGRPMYVLLAGVTVGWLLMLWKLDSLRARGLGGAFVVVCIGIRVITRMINLDIGEHDIAPVQAKAESLAKLFEHSAASLAAIHDAAALDAYLPQFIRDWQRMPQEALALDAMEKKLSNSARQRNRQHLDRDFGPRLLKAAERIRLEFDRLGGDPQFSLVFGRYESQFQNLLQEFNSLANRTGQAGAAPNLPLPIGPPIVAGSGKISTAAGSVARGSGSAATPSAAPSARGTLPQLPPRLLAILKKPMAKKDGLAALAEPLSPEKQALLDVDLTTIVDDYLAAMTEADETLGRILAGSADSPTVADLVDALQRMERSAFDWNMTVSGLGFSGGPELERLIAPRRERYGEMERKLCEGAARLREDKDLRLHFHEFRTQFFTFANAELASAPRFLIDFLAAATQAPPLPSMPSAFDRKPIDPQEEAAERAFRTGSSGNGLDFLRAKLLLGSEADLKKAVRWCPAVEHAASHVFWGFAAEVLLGSAPANAAALPAGPGKLNLARVKERPHNFELSAAGELSRQTGQIGEWIGDGLKGRFSDGGFGQWGDLENGSILERRGITLLGIGSRSDAFAAAAAQRIDILLFATLVKKRAIGGKQDTSIRLSLWDVPSGKMLWQSQSVSNSQITSGRNKGSDPSAELVDAALGFIDENLLLREMPSNVGALVQMRAEALGRRDVYDPLAALVELRGYVLHGLLPEERALSQIVAIVGERHVAEFLSPEPSKRMLAIKPLLPKY